ncbi:MAG: shikimate dehydrogenase [Gammaproteobacteria bacterium]|nr:shikimate dehydrogenase [Gammaproteobacteria bacterium]
MTDRYGVIGHPIAHSKSPIIHQLFAKQTKQDISYEAFDIRPDDLDKEVRRLVKDGLRGFNVTVPHKEAIAELADVLVGQALRCKAVNTVTVAEDGTLAGDNTDGLGLLRDLRRNLRVSLAGELILILGAGGATRGIVPALLEAEPAELKIANRTSERAELLADEFGEYGPVQACTFDALEQQPFDLVINATSAGLRGETPPFPSSIIGPDTVCYDLSYAMSETPFLSWAREHGGENLYQGWGMLVEQAAESFMIWRGERPDTEDVLRRLRRPPDKLALAVPG